MAKAPGSRDAWEQAGAGERGGRNAAGEHQQRERKTLGCDCSPLPTGPSNAAPVGRINRKGSKAARMLQGCDPTLRPHSSSALRCAEPREWEGKGRGDFFFFFSLGWTCYSKQPEKGKMTFAPGWLFQTYSECLEEG